MIWMPITFAFSPRNSHSFSSRMHLNSHLLLVTTILTHCNIINRCLDSILHAEHKSVLEEMRSDYHLTNSLQTHNSDPQVVANPNGNDSDMVTNDINGIGIEEDQKLYDYQDQREKPILCYPGLDLTSLLRSLDIPAKKDYDRGSRFVPNHTHTIMPF